MRSSNHPQLDTLPDNVLGSEHEILNTIHVPLHRIISFSNVEGQGNRTSIFLQGCKLNCLYCHNPETIPRYDDNAKIVSLEYLYEQACEAMPFIRGVTISGGEPTLHHRKLVPLFKALKQKGLTCYIDTSGFFDFKSMSELIEVTDKFLFDLKGTGLGLQGLCFDRKNKQGKVDLDQISVVQQAPLSIKTKNLARNWLNLTKLLPLGKIEEVRLVVINGFFDCESLVKETSLLLSQYPDVTLKLIRVHEKGARDPQGLIPLIPSINDMEKLTLLAKSSGVKNIITIC